MDKKIDTPAEVETVTVTMSRPVAEAVQAACEMYLRLHMGQFNDLAEDLCMAKHYADMDAKRFKNAEDEKEDFYRALENRNMMQDDMDRAYQMFACHPLIEDGMHRRWKCRNGGGRVIRRPPTMKLGMMGMKPTPAKPV